MADTPTLERGDYVTVQGWDGIAFWYTNGCDQYRLDEFGERTDDCLHGECVIVVMVGDDVGHHVQLDAVTPLDRDKFCGGCGQIGCGHGG